MADCPSVNLNSPSEPSVTLNFPAAPIVSLNYPLAPSVNLGTPSAPSISLSSAPPLNLSFYAPPFFPAGSQFSLSVTGSSSLGSANFTGIGGTIIFTSGGIIFISGASGNGGGGGNTTGTNVQITGGSILNFANFTGIGGTIVFTSGGFVYFSGNNSFDALGTAANTGQILYQTLLNFSGTFQDFSVSALTGLSGSQTINFPIPFSSIPTEINVSMTILSGNNFGYTLFNQNITQTGFLCLFSDNLLETGNLLDIHAHI